MLLLSRNSKTTLLSCRQKSKTLRRAKELISRHRESKTGWLMRPTRLSPSFSKKSVTQIKCLRCTSKITATISASQPLTCSLCRKSWENYIRLAIKMRRSQSKSSRNPQRIHSCTSETNLRAQAASPTTAATVVPK